MTGAPELIAFGFLAGGLVVTIIQRSGLALRVDQLEQDDGRQVKRIKALEEIAAPPMVVDFGADASPEDFAAMEAAIRGHGPIEWRHITGRPPIMIRKPAGGVRETEAFKHGCAVIGPALDGWRRLNPQDSGWGDE